MWKISFLFAIISAVMNIGFVIFTKINKTEALTLSVMSRKGTSIKYKAFIKQEHE